LAALEPVRLAVVLAVAKRDMVINSHLDIANKALKGMFPLAIMELLIISNMVLVDNFLAVAGNSPIVDSRMDLIAARIAGKERKIVGCSL